MQWGACCNPSPPASPHHLATRGAVVQALPVAAAAAVTAAAAGSCAGTPQGPQLGMTLSGPSRLQCLLRRATHSLWRQRGSVLSLCVQDNLQACRIMQ